MFLLYLEKKQANKQNQLIRIFWHLICAIGGEYLCDKCSYTTKSLNSLKVHKEIKHEVWKHKVIIGNSPDIQQVYLAST